MSKSGDKSIASHKMGAEEFIMMRLHSDRFHKNIPPHIAPSFDSKSRYQVALLAQACESISFDSNETGQCDELHLWLQLASLEESEAVKGAELMLPSMRWYQLASASSNATSRGYLKTFGFSPMNLEKIYLHEHGGAIAFPDGGMIEWSTTGHGKSLPRVGVNHVVYTTKDGPNAVGHRIAALLSDTVMEQSGRVSIQTKSLEPFLFEGEMFAAAVNRMSKLEADVIWQQH